MSDVPNHSPSRGSGLRLLADRTFGPYFFGNLISNIGTWFQQIAAAIVVYQVTGSALMVGLVGVSQFGPSLLLAPWTGAAADRFDRRRLLVAAQLVATAGGAALAVLLIVVGVEGLPGVWPVLVATLVIGIGNAVSVPAQQALIPALVSLRDLDQAVALNSVTYNLARAVGPALGALVLVRWGPAIAFSVNAVSYLALIGALLAIRPRPIQVSSPGRHSIWSGFRLLRQDPTVAVLLVGITALGFGADPMVTLSPALAADLARRPAGFGSPDALVGLIVSAFGVGAMAATSVIGRVRGRWGHRKTALGGLTLLGGGALGLATAAHPAVALGSMLVAGFGFLFGVTALTTLLHLRIPEHLRGRVMALWGFAFLGSRPLAAFVDGTIADLSSPRLATAMAAGVVFLCALVVVRYMQPEEVPSGSAVESI